jgi:SAM-dependent methyltransferase
MKRFDDHAWWDEFFADREKPCPFFVEWPDENLVTWVRDGLLAPGRVLELGCGNGRNAVYLAGLGCRVDAVDFSARALEWARERAEAASVAVDFQCGSILRQMKKADRCFAEDFLWALLATTRRGV